MSPRDTEQFRRWSALHPLAWEHVQRAPDPDAVLRELLAMAQRGEMRVEWMLPPSDAVN